MKRFFLLWQDTKIYNTDAATSAELEPWCHDGLELVELEVPEDFEEGKDLSQQYWNGSEFRPFSERPLDRTNANVNSVRDQIIRSGKSFTVTGYGDVPLTGSTEDKLVYLAQLFKASEAKAANIAAPIIVIRDKHNVIHKLTPEQAIELVTAAIAWIEKVMEVSWAMKDKTTPFEAGIPADFSNISYWEV